MFDSRDIYGEQYQHPDPCAEIQSRLDALLVVVESLRENNRLREKDWVELFLEEDE